MRKPRGPRASAAPAVPPPPTAIPKNARTRFAVLSREAAHRGETDGLLFGIEVRRSSGKTGRVATSVIALRDRVATAWNRRKKTFSATYVFVRGLAACGEAEIVSEYLDIVLPAGAVREAATACTLFPGTPPAAVDMLPCFDPEASEVMLRPATGVNDPISLLTVAAPRPPVVRRKRAAAAPPPRSPHPGAAIIHRSLSFAGMQKLA